MEKEFLSRLTQIDDLEVAENVPMSRYTSFRIGGEAQLLLCPKTREALKEAVKTVKAEKLPLYIIGAGSNLLISDQGIPGVVIRLASPFDGLTAMGNTITAEAGVSLAKLSAYALEQGLSGLEFAGGIPGTLGGAVFMNAGAYGGEMSQVVTETEYLDPEGNIKTIQDADHDFGYRSSFFSRTGGIVLASRMHLCPQAPEKIREVMQDFGARRREKQPLNFPSAGSVFKRPAGYFAGKLIEDSGLKGVTIGGAQVSEKHAGFIINLGGATAQDVYDLIHHVRAVVFEKFNVILETEVRMLGNFSD